MILFRISVDPVQHRGLDCEQYSLYVSYPCDNGVQETCSYTYSLDEFEGLLEGVIRGLALSGVYLTDFRLITPNRLLHIFAYVMSYCMEDCDASFDPSL